MSDVLPDDVRDGLDLARSRARRTGATLKIRIDDRDYGILRFWNGGFALDAETAPPLRGLVDVFRGDDHVYSCLVVASAEDAGQTVYEFKRQTAAVDRPPLDFAVEEPEGAAGRAGQAPV